NRTGFRDHLVTIGNHWRLAERMHLAQLGRRQHGFCVALVMTDLVRHAQLFKQPEHALRARIVQVVNSNHVDAPFVVARSMTPSRVLRGSFSTTSRQEFSIMRCISPTGTEPSSTTVFQCFLFMW